MSNILFSEREIQLLTQNQYVQSVSTKSITYTNEFKRKFVVENENGKIPRKIFEECGFEIDLIGMDRVESAGKRWRAAYKKDGVSGLQDTRKSCSGRPRIRELSLEEKLERLKAQNLLLRAENELLKNIEMAERRLRRNSQQK